MVQVQVQIGLEVAFPLGGYNSQYFRRLQSSAVLLVPILDYEGGCNVQRLYWGSQSSAPPPWVWRTLYFEANILALGELFDKADTSKDGTLSLQVTKNIYNIEWHSTLKPVVTPFWKKLLDHKETIYM